MPICTPIVTLLAVAFYFFLATRVATARIKFAVKHPATTGAVMALRNLLRRSCCGSAWSILDRGPCLVFCRLCKGVEKRLPGFFIQWMACLLLFLGAAASIFRHMMGG